MKTNANKLNPLTPKSDYHGTSPYDTCICSLFIQYPNLSDQSCYLNLTPNSCNLFTKKCVAAKGEN